MSRTVSYWKSVITGYWSDNLTALMIERMQIEYYCIKCYSYLVSLISRTHHHHHSERNKTNTDNIAESQTNVNKALLCELKT